MAPRKLLDGKVIIVTGASQGIGRAIALGCAAEGARILLHWYGEKDSQAAVDIDLVRRIIDQGEEGCPSSVTVQGDISDPKTSEEIVDTAVRSFGRIDGLVSNAGICQFYSFLDIPHEVYNRTRRVNMDGTFYIVQAVAKYMSTQDLGGSIVAISSISALVGGEKQAHYTPTKAGVKSLMESCAVSLGPYRIRCNSILPGTIETAINKADLSDPTKRSYMEGRIPLGRLGAPDDIVGPVVFLLSDMSSYMTGSSILVDGGLFVNLQ